MGDCYRDYVKAHPACNANRAADSGSVPEVRSQAEKKKALREEYFRAKARYPALTGQKRLELA